MIAETLALVLLATVPPADRVAAAGNLLASGLRAEAEARLVPLARSGGEAGEDASLALGRLYLEEGRPDRALPLLVEVADGGGLLAGWAGLYAARALAGMDRPGDALKRLEGPMEAGPAGAEALLERADLLAGTGRPAEAARDYAAFLEAAAEHPRRREAAFLRAASLEGAGTAAQALEAYWEIWWDDPGSPKAEEARDRASALAGTADVLALPASKPLERLDHAGRLRKAGRSKAAADAYAELARLLGGAPRREAFYGEAFSHYRGWRTREVTRALDRLLADPGGQRCRGLALRARNFWIRASDRKAARETARLLADTCPWSTDKGEEGREEGLWILAHLALGRDRIDEAAPLLGEIAAVANNRREAAAWKLGLIRLQGGRPKEAAAAFEELAEATESPGYRAAALYWAGRAWIAAHGTEAGEGWLRLLVVEQPLSYYGMRARTLLAAQGRPAPVPGRRPLPPGTLDGVPEALKGLPGYRRALRLERAGLTDLAGTEFLALHEGGGEPPPGIVLRAARAYAPTRWAYRGVRLMRQAFGDWEDVVVEGGEPEGFREALYPRPFRDLYTKEGERRGLDPALALAISRQESLFDPEIRSWAGAVGLMQLMPETAAEEAKKLGLPRPNDEDLADPARNVELGVFHLAGLLERFGSVPAAVAAYNAGGGRVAKWLKERPLEGEGAVAEDLWIDSIPITQTRLYVKSVLRALDEYRRLYPD